MNNFGKVYLVGAGPGDPGLLTLKGKSCLEQADLILYDGLVNPLILRHTQATAERTNRIGTGSQRRLNQEEINKRLVAAAKSGKTVVRLKGGDPFIFGRGSEEANALADAGIAYEVVPGITAATAASVYAGISLTHREHASAVAFITGHEDPQKNESALDYNQLARFPGTLVFYMGLHRIADICAALIENGKTENTPVAVISRGSTPRQRTVTGTLKTVAEDVKQAEITAPSLIIVGNCVLQRDQINWFETLPLAGMTIGITRPEHQTEQAIQFALDRGANPLLMPTIEIHELEDWTLVDQTIQRIDGYDWIVFTSVNGVDAFLGRLQTRGQDARSFATCKIACIGPATAQRVRDHSLIPDLVPEVYRGEALAAELKPDIEGKRVLWPRANRGREIIPEELTAAGAEFDSLIVYEHRDVENFSEEVSTSLAEGSVDWIGLSSPTIAENVAALISKIDFTKSPKFVAISPVTEAAAKQAGLEVAAVASEHTWNGIFTAIEQTVSQQ